MTALLDLQAVTSGYGEVRVLESVSLEVAAGSITALVGSNGAGKTTLMRAIAGLLPLAAGRILLDGVDIGLAPTHRRIELGLALVPEGRLIFPDFTVEENLKIGAIARHARPNASAGSKRCSRCFRGSASAASRPAGRCRAASSRCWPWPAA